MLEVIEWSLIGLMVLVGGIIAVAAFIAMVKSPYRG